MRPARVSAASDKVWGILEAVTNGVQFIRRLHGTIDVDGMNTAKTVPDG